jgi:hypothetical protein
MLEALCRQSSTTLDIVHAEDGPPITQRTSGLGSQLVLLSCHARLAHPDLRNGKVRVALSAQRSVLPWCERARY